MQPQHITIFDTTLRDGQQCPGAGMSFDKNIEYAHLVAKAGIDVIEAGFPSASQTDFMIVRTIAEELAHEPNNPIIAGLCQLREKQFITTMEALQPALPAQKARLHTYLPVDPELMSSSLGEYANQKQQIVEDVYRLIKIAVAAGMEVEFSAEGYSRIRDINFNFTTDVFMAAVSAGASIINCPDTIGGACKLEGSHYYVELMKQHAQKIQQAFPNQAITWSVHCHNDFGLALENSINGVFYGPATQIEGCFNGIGERAGNVSIEQCIMYVKYFGQATGLEKTYTTRINTDMLQSISDFVGRYMLPRQPHWPITGDNAAKHSSGGHTNAVIRNPLAYQPFDPKEIGKEISFLFGPLSGGNHAKSIIENFGYRCEESEKAVMAQFIKNHYADRRKGITDQELLQAYFQYRKPIKAAQFDYAKVGKQSHLKISGAFFNHAEGFEITCQGADSALAALHKAISNFFAGLTIENYQSQAATRGIDSISQSKITIKNSHNEFFNGQGEDQDIEISALKALADAVNQAYIHQNYKIRACEVAV